MTGPIEHWAVAVTTAPRPVATLPRTLDSLRRAGWSDLRVFHDSTGAGAWRNWIEALASLVRDQPAADAFAMVQDDVVLCRELKTYLQETLWPIAGRVALCSPFTPGAYRRCRPGWSFVWPPPDRFLVAAQFWVIPPATARAIVRDLGHIHAHQGIDRLVGRWAKRSGRNVWHHTPSLAQHTADDNSALGNPPVADLRLATDFIGEDAAPKVRQAFQPDTAFQSSYPT